MSVVAFWKPEPGPGGTLGPGCLSQWWRSRFVVDGQAYPTAEHFMMAEKARLFGDSIVRANILLATDPGKVKALGREVKGFDEAIWVANRVRIVEEGSFAKFSQDSALRDYLLGTGDAVLVEASPRDRIWGVGLGPDNPKVADQGSWRGLNLLGFALMAARSALREGRTIP